jgi:hypothetical protein
VISSIES